VKKPKRDTQRRPMGLAFKGPLLLIALLAVVLILILAYEGNGTLTLNNATPVSSPKMPSQQ
jgi:hypothetical protein